MFVNCLLFLLYSSAVCGFRSILYTKLAQANSALRDVPLELDGKLDPSKSWPVKFLFRGEEKVIQISEDTSFLEAGERNFKGVQSSCRNGVCTTCAGQVII